MIFAGMGISASTISTRRFSRVETPSSILSLDDIRFTRKLGGQYRCGCCVLAAFLLFLLLSSLSIYLGYTLLRWDSPEDQVFLATFRVVGGDSFTIDLADPSTEAFRIRAREYRDRLNLCFRRSKFRISFISSDVLALDGIEHIDLVVHTELRFDPRYQTLTVSDIVNVLMEEIDPKTAKYLSNLQIDPRSLEVQENLSVMNVQMSISKVVTSLPTITTPALRTCSKSELAYCKHLAYNFTSYPNIFNHRSMAEVEEDLITFRELVDAECYRYAYDFICQVLQPACTPGQQEATIQLPCRSFCREFWSGCGNRLTNNLKSAFECYNFPEFADNEGCRPQPGCIQFLKSQRSSSRICDGIIDCPDSSDEKDCAYCARSDKHCGLGETCIHNSQKCDGKVDCPNGNDEKECLFLAESVTSVLRQPIDTLLSSKYVQEGYVLFNEKGTIGKICVENLITMLPSTEVRNVLQTVATSLCTLLTYKGMISVETRIDEENDVQYVHIENPLASEISFVGASCPSKEVMYVHCAELECGIPTMQAKSISKVLKKIAEPGDWPWHVALFKKNIHVCDATLVSYNWLLTTASCFQGQPKSEWSARLGTIRLSSTPPWQQERRIIGMIKSPVEGSTIVLLKLDHPSIVYSDFVRPICLPSNHEIMQINSTYCNTLGWAKNRDVLQRVQLKYSTMDKCENMSITSVNSICTEATYYTDDCSEEELAGSPLLCLLPDGRRWAIAGVSSWRIACSKSAIERPRLYDKVSSNIAWIKSIIA